MYFLRAEQASSTPCSSPSSGAEFGDVFSASTNLLTLVARPQRRYTPSTFRPAGKKTKHSYSYCFTSCCFVATPLHLSSSPYLEMVWRGGNGHAQTSLSKETSSSSAMGTSKHSKAILETLWVIPGHPLAPTFPREASRHLEKIPEPPLLVSKLCSKSSAPSYTCVSTHSISEGVPSRPREKIHFSHLDLSAMPQSS